MSPVSSYYGGEGRTVMKNMKEEYGDDEGKRVFYATANKQAKKSSKKKSRRRSKKA